MASGIGVKIGLDGDVDFRNSLKGINGELRSVRSEMRSVTQEFKDNSDSTEALTAKNKVLQKEIDLQTSKLKVLSSEYEKQVSDLTKLENKLEDARQKYGENSDEVIKAQREYDNQASKVRKLETDIGTASSTLNKHTKDMDTNSAAIKEQGTETDKLKKEMSELGTELTGLESEQKKLTSSFKLQKAELGNNATEADKTALAQKQLSQQMELTDKVVNNLESQLSKAKQAYGENSKEVQELETKLNGAKTEVAEFKNKLDDVEQGGKNASDGLGTLEDGIQSLSLFAMADALQGVSDKLIDFGKKAMDAFEEVDSGMDIIVTKTGATGEAMNGFEDVYNNVASSMYTQSFEDVGSAIGELNTQFGLTGDALTEASEYMLMYADINGSDVTTASINAKQAIEAYGLSNEDLIPVLDAVTTTAQGTGQSVDSLFEKAVTGAPQIKALGLSFEEGVQLMGNFEKAGVDSSQALASLSKASVEYAKDGKTLSEGLNETQEAILGAANETDALTIATEVFGTKGAVRMVDAIQRGVINLEDLATTSEETAGTVVRTFEETLDPIDRFKQMGREISLAMSPLGNAIAVAFQPLIDMAVPAIQKLSQGFQALGQPLQTVIVAIGGLLAGFVALMPIAAIIVATFNTLAPIFAGITGALGTGGLGGALAALAGPVGIAVAAVVAFIAIIKGAWDESEIFRDAVGQAFETIKTTITESFERIKEAFAPLTEKFQGFGDTAMPIFKQIGDFLGEKIIPVVTQFINSFVSGFTNIIIAMAPFIEAIMNLASIIGNFVGMVVAILSGDWSLAWEYAKEIGQGVVDFLGNLWEGLKQVFETIFGMIVASIKEKWEAIKTKTTEIWDGIKKFLSDTLQAIYDNTIGKVKEVFDGVSTKWQETKTDTANKWNDIKTDLANKWQDIKTDTANKVKDTATNVANKWQETKTDTATKWENIKSDLATKVQGIFTDVTGKIKEIVTDLLERWGFIKDDADIEWDKIKETIISYVKDLPGEMYDYAVDMLTKMKKGITDTASDVWGAMTTLANDLKEKFKKALGINSPSSVFKEFGLNIVQGLLGGLNADSVMDWVNNIVEEIKSAFKNGNFSISAAVDFVGSGIMEFFKSIGIGGAQVGDMEVPVQGGITSEYGWRTHPIWGDQRFHDGIDIGAGYGANVVASGSGTVNMARYNGGYGNMVRIDHGGGLESFYAHLSAILVSFGQLVTKGQLIGRVGSTGDSTGAHLHFGLHQDGQSIDPSSIWGYARGTNFATSGYHWVGERGPELMKFNGGEQVLDNKTSQKVAGGITQHITINSPQPLSPAKTARLNRRAMQDFALGL